MYLSDCVENIFIFFCFAPYMQMQENCFGLGCVCVFVCKVYPTIITKLYDCAIICSFKGGFTGNFVVFAPMLL